MLAGTKTLFFSDIEGSTRLLRALGDRWPEMLHRHREIVRGAIGKHGGEEQGTEGDGFFVVFDRAGAACAAALEIQAALRLEPWPGDTRLAVRIGLHTGEVSRPAGEDLVGMAIHQAARIAAVAHGGQIVLSEATRLLAEETLPVGSTIRPLGAHHLKDIDRPVVLHQLSDPTGVSSFPPLRTLAASRDNLPAPATSFVGGSAAIEGIEAALHTSRLVTLTGAGGCGKTRLAVEVGRRLLDRHADGVWLVELGSVSDGHRVAGSIADALGVHTDAERPASAALLAYLQRLDVLIVLDNCEHLLDAAGEIVGALLRGCPGVRILATSREPLGVDGESTWRVASLAVPDDEDHTATTEQLVASPSVALFLDRALAADPELRPTPADVVAIAGICRRLDGIPLAIELAASRVGVLSIAELTQRLERSFKVLSGGRRAALPRQQTIDATVDWSYGLLDEDTRSVLRRFAVFRGGATMDAAEAVCAGEDEDLDVFEALSDLVRKSLVQRERSTTGTRYRLLEPVRQFALARLLAEEDASLVRDRHRDHFVLVAGELGRRIDDARLDGALREYVDEVQNFRGAFEWVAAVGPPAALVRLVGSIGRALVHVASEEERLAMCQEALAVDPMVEPASRIDVLHTASMFRSEQDDPDRLLDEAEELALAIGDERRLTRIRLGRASSANSRFATSMRTPDEVLRMLEELRPEVEALPSVWRARYFIALTTTHARRGDREAEQAALSEVLALGADAGATECYARYLAGMVALRRGEESTAEEHFEAALASCEREGPMHGESYVLGRLGALRVRQGDVAAGLALLQQGSAIALRRGVPHDIGMSLGIRARSLIEAGRLDEARALVDEALERTQGLGGYARAQPLLAAAQLAALDGDPEGARRALEQVIAFRSVGPTHLAVEVLAGEAAVMLERLRG